MLVTAFNGSHRKIEGNTWMMVDAFLSGAAAAGADVGHVRLADRRIGFCQACKRCWFQDPGRCHLDDDGNELVAAYLRSDLVVFASPLYVDNVSGLMKTFLDRLITVGDPHWDLDEAGECVHRPRFQKPTRMVAIMNCGYPEQSHFAPMRLLFRRMARNLHLQFAGEILRGGGGLLTNCEPALKPQMDDYLGLVRKAGREAVSLGEIQADTTDRLERPLLPGPDFSERFREKVNEICDSMGKG